MESSSRYTHRAIRAALSVALVFIVFATVVAVAAFSPTWFGSLWFYFIEIAALGFISAMFYLTGREKSLNP